MLKAFEHGCGYVSQLCPGCFKQAPDFTLAITQPGHTSQYLMGHETDQDAKKLGTGHTVNNW